MLVLAMQFSKGASRSDNQSEGSRRHLGESRGSGLDTRAELGHQVDEGRIGGVVDREQRERTTRWSLLQNGTEGVTASASTG